MTPFTHHDGLVLPIDRPNVDTDAILPKQYLKSVKRTGFGPVLFDEWRYLDHGEIGIDPATRIPNPDFVMNNPGYEGASILLARDNFGCGSSREHAPWAIADYGIRALIAPSFADIFRGNCLKNGLLPVVLTENCINALFEKTLACPGYRLTVDLVAQTVSGPDGFATVFVIGPTERTCLLEGLDEIMLTLRKAESISMYESRRRAIEPWLFANG